jgi:serine/threonine protein kinase
LSWKKCHPPVILFVKTVLFFRDIKLENVLVNFTEEGYEVKLADFGTAAFCSSTNHLAGKYGTIEYMAPEMLAGGKYSQTVDMWSIGILASTLILGEFPF